MWKAMESERGPPRYVLQAINGRSLDCLRLNIERIHNTTTLLPHVFLRFYSNMQGGECLAVSLPCSCLLAGQQIIAVKWRTKNAQRHRQLSCHGRSY
jgi:hypothetical protein